MRGQDENLFEKNFIDNGLNKTFSVAWLWLFIITALLAVLWGIGALFREETACQVFKAPFLQVTNRKLSVFLWQYSSLMRINSNNKNAYLPGFQYIDGVNPELQMVDQYAVAPPEVLFLYHAWDRLIGCEFARRTISPEEFQNFLRDVPEWAPQNWADAPLGYIQLVESLSHNSVADLQEISEDFFPMIVRQSFQGWKNYYKEGESINRVKASYGEMKMFLEQFPYYGRSYWKNILEETTPKYLHTVSDDHRDPQAIIPSFELSSFLKVAFFNFQQAKLEQEAKKAL